MVRAIITWSLHNRLIVLLATLGLVIAGLHSASNLRLEAQGKFPLPSSGGRDKSDRGNEDRDDCKEHCHERWRKYRFRGSDGWLWIEYGGLHCGVMHVGDGTAHYDGRTEYRILLQSGTKPR